MQVQPYLVFDGQCDEAIEFYRKALGAEVIMLIRFKDHPGAVPASESLPGLGEKVMHSSLRVGESVILASDGRCLGKPNFQGISLALTVDDDAEAERRFNALADGGHVQMPLAATFFASRFGMVADRFGLTWMVLTKS